MTNIKCGTTALYGGLVFSGMVMAAQEAPVTYRSTLSDVLSKKLTPKQEKRIRNDWRLPEEQKKQFLEKGRTPAQENQLNSMLRYQVYKGDRIGIRDSILQGADIKKGRVKNHKGEFVTPLLDAIDRKDTATARMLISSGADVNDCGNTEWTPLMLAVTKGDINTVKALIEAGADVNYKNSYDGTILHFAAAQGSVDIFNALIAARANVDAKNKNGSTVLHWAASFGNVAIVNALINAQVNVKARNKNERTALHVAASQGNVDVVNALIEAHTPVRAKDEEGRTALMLAIKKGNVDAALALIAAKPKEHVNKQNNKGWTPLMQAVQKGNLAIVDALISAGAKVDDFVIEHENGQGLTVSPLTLAVKKRDINIVNSLIRADATLSTASEDPETPLLCAIDQGDIDIVRALLRADECHYIVNEQHYYRQWTPLMLAIYRGNLAIVNVLLEAGASVNTLANGDLTPLMFAADLCRRSNHADAEAIFVTLIKAGADPRAKEGRYGLTAFDILKGNDDWELVSDYWE